jgi:hypothetical protein
VRSSGLSGPLVYLVCLVNRLYFRLAVFSSEVPNEPGNDFAGCPACS